jgi:hypothetical protein
MSYGLRRYETIHRLWWFVFFILCLFLARYSQVFTHVPRQGAEFKDLKRIDFWTGLQGICMTSPGPERSVAGQDRPGRSVGKPASEPSAGRDDFQDNIELVSSTMLFLIRAGIIFLELRLIWLLVQFAGRYLLQIFMSENRDPKSIQREPGRGRPEPLFPMQAFAEKVRRSPLSFFLHPFIRLKLMLSGVQKNISAENLFEKERRVVEADWNILYGSWGPYRVLFWVLPILGLVQTILLLTAQFNLSSSAVAVVPQKEAIDAIKPMFSLSPQKEILDAIRPTLNLLLPLIQAAGAAIFFQLASTLLRYFEELYLFNLDSFIYDRLLSRLPLRSSDTIIILESLQGQFRDLQAALKRLENKILPQTEVEKK